MDNSGKNLSVGVAVTIGHLLITVPVFAIFASFMLFFYYRGWSVLLGAIIGTIPGWLFWSVTIPVWRRWALKNGADADELEKWATRAGLTWPKGSPPAKTEIDLWKNKSDKH